MLPIAALAHSATVMSFATLIVSCAHPQSAVRPLGAVITATGLVEALILAITSTEIAVLLCLKSFYIVVLSVDLRMSGASLGAALLKNFAHDAVAELADFRTNVFSSFEGADADDCVADQVAIACGRAKDQTDEEECFVVDAVESFAEALDALQLFSASAPVLVFVAAFDDASLVSRVTDDRSTVEDTAQIANRLVGRILRSCRC